VAAHRFIPRFRALAILAVVAGAGATIAGIAGLLATAALAAGAIGCGFGAAYLLSPTWRIAVEAGSDALRVTRGKKELFALPWAEVEQVVASPSTSTCFVDGGDPERSLLVPGFGAPASYDITNKATLVASILEAVPSERVTEVETLDRYQSS
jgi:hypothetical protein